MTGLNGPQLRGGSEPFFSDNTGEIELATLQGEVGENLSKEDKDLFSRFMFFRLAKKGIWDESEMEETFEAAKKIVVGKSTRQNFIEKFSRFIKYLKETECKNKESGRCKDFFGGFDLQDLDEGKFADKMANHLFPKKRREESQETNQEKLHRAEIAQDMRSMETRTIRVTEEGEKIKPQGVPSVHKGNDYYGTFGGKNVPGEFINKTLKALIPENVEQKGNIIILSRMRGKYYLAFYRNGTLEIATYVSVGLQNGHKTNSNEVIVKNSSAIQTDKFHASSEYPEENPGAAMPYAVSIDPKRGVWFHGSSSAINGNQASHGCVRTPLFYIKKLYDVVNEIKAHEESLTIDIKNLY